MNNGRTVDVENAELDRRILLALDVSNGLEARELADLLGVPRETISKRMFRLKKRGRVYMAESRGSKPWKSIPENPAKHPLHVLWSTLGQAVAHDYTTGWPRGV
ncbi:winged helix-turn-helix domain-containing protein [uncultured Paraglaciecola sp.]|uniref:winged helix-turn-helix domain-containing protein n=1 Tax=uncultured Paraglaciecola sp. TaxID=1765024 RepID=UPI0026231F9D|nr:winged helix-turn-helix domain-containing protein [uncultured Paraglaciecola sp.]